MEQLDAEVLEKVESGQARIVWWNDIRRNPPPQLKISPVAINQAQIVPVQGHPWSIIFNPANTQHKSTILWQAMSIQKSLWPNGT